MHFMKNLARVKKFPLSPPSGSNTPLSAAGHLLGFTLPADIQRKIVYFFFFFWYKRAKKERWTAASGGTQVAWESCGGG